MGFDMIDITRFLNSFGLPVEVTNKRPLPVIYGDSAALDSFARLRTSEPVGIFENKNIQSRRRNQWSEPIDGVIVEHGAVTGGPFQVGETITGATSNGTGTITIVNAGDLNVDVNHNDFEDGETITGGISDATAVLSSVDTGSNIEHLINEASILLTAGKISGDRAIRQTIRYHAYLPGKSQLINITFVFGTDVTDVRRRVGLFDDMNGMYIEQNNGLFAVLRSFVTGSIVDTRIAQEDWNIDKLDGKGISGIIFDETKSQILVIDFQWLGVGRIRLGLSIDGMTHYFHEFLNANTLDTAYMGTPTLPIRYEIEALAALNENATMKEICCAVTSEGGYVPPGFEFSASSEWVEREVGITRIPVFAIRLKNLFSDNVLTNRRTVKFIDAGFFTRSNDVLFEVAHIHDPSDIVATWIDEGGGSGVEYSVDISAVTGNPTHKIDHRHLAAGQGSSGSQDAVEAFIINAHSFLSQNYDSDNSQMFVIYATARAGTANVSCHITWVEFE